MSTAWLERSYASNNKERAVKLTIWAHVRINKILASNTYLIDCFNRTIQLILLLEGISYNITAALAFFLVNIMVDQSVCLLNTVASQILGEQPFSILVPVTLRLLPFYFFIFLQ